MTNVIAELIESLKVLGRFAVMIGFILFCGLIGWQWGRGYEATQQTKQFDGLIENIWQVESSRRITAPVGDEGQSFGPLQISRDALIDVNRWYGKRYTIEDLQDLATAKQIARLYISMWLDANKDEIAARIFNGGPRGWEKQSTKEYWSKVSGQRATDSGQRIGNTLLPSQNYAGTIK
jgi:hypothetical protein